MIRRAMVAGVLMLACVASALAADVTGRWESTFSTPNGDIQLVFHFKADGTKLTGSVETPNGDVDIENGKVDGDKISFSTHVGEDEVKHSGTISGDTIALGVDGPWGHSDMTLKRAEEKEKKE
jgi:FlaG/FlaF family flagellin (archaellin)